MKKRTCWLLAGAGVLTIGVSCFLALPGRSGAADAPGDSVEIPANERAQLIDDSIKTIESVLGGKADKPGFACAQTAAIMIAAFAQHGPAATITPQRAGLRDAALALADAIKNDQLDQAKKLVKGLKTAGAGSKTAKVKILDDKIEMEPFMTQFASPRSGGLGIEKKLEDLEEAKNLPAEDLPALLLIANRSIVVADMAKGHDPDKKKKQWDGFADAMAKRAGELAVAARAGTRASRSRRPRHCRRAAMIVTRSSNDPLAGQVGSPGASEKKGLSHGNCGTVLFFRVLFVPLHFL